MVPADTIIWGTRCLLAFPFGGNPGFRIWTVAFFPPSHCLQKICISVNWIHTHTQICFFYPCHIFTQYPSREIISFSVRCKGLFRSNWTMQGKASTPWRWESCLISITRPIVWREDVWLQICLPAWLLHSDVKLLLPEVELVFTYLGPSGVRNHGIGITELANKAGIYH